MKNSKSLVTNIFLVAAFLFTCFQVSSAQVVAQKQRVVKSPVMKSLLPDIAVELKSLRSLAVPTAAGRMKSGLTPGALIGKHVKVVVKNIGNRDTGKFFVDLVLSSDTKVPVKMAVYSAVFKEDVLILGGRLSVANLAPGKSQTLSLPAQSKIPDKIRAGIYYLAAVADPGQTVKEKDELNNVALKRIKVNPLPPPSPPVTISSVGQTGYWSSGSGHFEVGLGGSGFGNTIGNKTVRIGSHEFGAAGMELWSDTLVIVWLPNDFPLGNRFDIAVWENGNLVSNVKQNVLLYMDITAGEFTTPGGAVFNEPPPAGTTIRMSGLFGTTQGSCVVKFGGVEAQIVSWAYNAIHFVLPNLSPGQYPVFVEKNGERVSFQVNFTISSPSPLPVTINSIGQTGYWASGGGLFEVNLSGSGFGSQCGNKTVRIGSYEAGAANMEFWSDTGAVVPLPYNFPYGNRHDIAVWENGSVVSNVKQNVLIYMDITAHEFTIPNGDPINEAPAGATIRMSGLFGANQGSCVVKFGGVEAQIVSWANNAIHFVLPNLPPGQYPVFVEKNGERVSFQVNFSISAP